MPANPAMFTEAEIKELRNGKVIDVGGKRFRLCAGCQQIIQINKTFFGSTHLCQ